MSDQVAASPLPEPTIGVQAEAEAAPEAAAEKASSPTPEALPTAAPTELPVPKSPTALARLAEAPEETMALEADTPWQRIAAGLDAVQILLVVILIFLGTLTLILTVQRRRAR
jgi:hypothetical protein